jgi:hypothetical protein
VYDGFVKYNRLATEITPNKAEIRFLEKGYLPDRNLDINRTILGTGTVSVPSGEKYMTIQATAPEGEYEGLILTINEEPIIAIQSSDYDFGLQVTRYIYPRIFDENYFEFNLQPISLDFNVNFVGGKNLNIESFADFPLLDFTHNFTGVKTINVSSFADFPSLDFTYNFTGDITINDSSMTNIVLLDFITTFSSQKTLQASNSSSSLDLSLEHNFQGIIGINTESQASVIDLDFTYNFVGIQGVLYDVNAYATATPVNIVVDFDDTPAFSYTLQTFEQLIGQKTTGTDVTVTAPSSYVLNGFTYTFVDWRVDETGQTSTNRIFTTTIDQQKTLRLRYVAFAFN